MTKRWSRSWSLIMMILLIYLLLNTTTPRARQSLNDLIKLETDIVISWTGNDIDRPIVPRNELKRLNVTVELRFFHGQAFSEGLYEKYLGIKGYAKAKINMIILKTPSWCSAVFQSPYIGLDLKNESKGQIGLYLVVDENAPAFTQGNIMIKAHFNGYGRDHPIGNVTKYFNLSFIPSYFPSISVTTPKNKNIRTIRPFDTTTFKLHIQNLGNEETIVFTKVTKHPKGWSVIAEDQVFLQTNDMKIMNLTIKPSNEFGVHDQQAKISVSLTPARSINISDTGETIQYSFLIKNQGFSTPGFEVFIFSIAILSVCVGLYHKKKIFLNQKHKININKNNK